MNREGKWWVGRVKWSLQQWPWVGVQWTTWRLSLNRSMGHWYIVTGGNTKYKDIDVDDLDMFDGDSMWK